MTQATDAVQYLGRAWKMARQRPLLPWVAIPALFNLLLFGTLYYMAGSSLSTWVGAITEGWAFTGTWEFLNPALEFMVNAVVILLWLLLLVVFASTFTIAVQLIAAPFMGLLAEKVDRQVCATPLAGESLGHMLVRTFRRELRKTWDWLWRSLLVLILVVVLWVLPGINILASVLWFLWSGWLLGIQYIDYGADNRQIPFLQMKQRVRSRPWLVLSFGCVVLGLTMLPLVNLVVMPVAVIAGTLIWVEALDDRVALRPAGATAPESS